MQKKQLGNILIIILTLLYPIFWLSPLPNLEEGSTRQVIGELFAGSAMILMAMGLILAAKPKWLEDYFNGLDKMYLTHRRIGLTALTFLFAHMLILLHLPPEEPGHFLGFATLFGISILILLTIAPRLPVLKRLLRLAYHHWRSTHRFMGIFFLMGFIHFTWVEPLSLGTLPGLYMALFFFAGLTAYLYKQIVVRFVKRPSPYQIAQVNHPTPTITELLLKPTSKPITFQAGQFQFIQFPDEKRLKEPHPFTISSAPGERHLRLAIKASGDWTTRLQRLIKPGMAAKIEGGYGRFNYKHTHTPQLWLAGGIGVTPFRSWVRDLRQNPLYPVHFVYMVRNQGEAAFWDEFEQAAQAYPNFRAHLHLSAENGRLNAKHLSALISDDLSRHTVYLCGPAALVKAFSKQLEAAGVSPTHIHFEAFNFR